MEKLDEKSSLGTEEKYSALFNSNPNYNFIIGLDGTILDLNEQAAQISSYLDDIVGKNFTELKDLFGEGEDPNKYKEILSLFLAGLDVEPVEIKIRDESDSDVWFELYPTLLEKDGSSLAAGNTYVGVSGFARAIHHAPHYCHLYRLLNPGKPFLYSFSQFNNIDLGSSTGRAAYQYWAVLAQVKALEYFVAGNYLFSGMSG